MVILNKVSICEACTLVEYVVVWLYIKGVELTHCIFLLDLIFDNESYVTKRQGDEFFKYQPVVIFEVKPVSSGV